MPNTDMLSDLDAWEQASLVRSGELTASELVDAAIARIEAANPQLNALASKDFASAREQSHRVRAKGPLCGVPTLLKDVLPYPGQPTSFGSQFFKGQVLPAGSDYTDALDAAGLIVLGKSSTSEFGLLGTTEPLVCGATRNPWDLSRSPGGSSGGAVAAVASGMVPIAHASDGGGSIRGPSSFCGLFGFKPSRGRTRSAGVPPELPTGKLLSDHCVSRSVRDSVVWLAATEHSHTSLPTIADLTRPERLKVGVHRRDVFGDMPTPEAIAALDRATALCTDLGHEVVEASGPQFDAHASSHAFFIVTGFALAGIFQQIRATMGGNFDGSGFEPFTQEIVGRAQGLDGSELLAATQVLDAAAAATERAIEPVDVLLSPTVPFEPFPLGLHGPSSDPDEAIAFISHLAGFTVPASLAGWPAMSVPLYWSDKGLPVGCHFAARAGEDARLFRLAFQLEVAAPWEPRLKALRARYLCHNV